jgi:hypothetical protein
LTGTRIQSTKPIQVIGGHDCTNVPSNIGYCDHLEESILPISNLGKDYFVAAPSLPPPNTQTSKAAFARIIAAEAGVTNLTYDPPNYAWPSAITGMGSYIEIDAAAPYRVMSDRRILVAQYMKGQDAGGGVGDPSLSIAIPTQQFRSNYLFAAPPNYDYSFANIIAPLGVSVMLDGALVTGFEQIGSSTYGVKRFLLGSTAGGVHNLSATSAIGLSVYGYGQYTSYWYPGGLDLTSL